MRIWKFPMPTNPITPGIFTLEMPDHHVTPLTAQIQYGQGQIWAVVADTKSFRRRQFRIVGTNEPIDEPLGSYLATIQQGPFVWHVFDQGWSN